jgi:dephospho-CoA kinase
MIKIALVGTSGSGKDYLASILMNGYNFKRAAFADPLREVCSSIFNIGEYGSDELKDTVIPEYGVTARNIWIHMSNSIRHLDDNIWIARTVNKIESMSGSNIVVTDCRTFPEMKALRKNGFKFVYIVRPENSKELNDYDMKNTVHLNLLCDFSYRNSNDRTIEEFMEAINRNFSLNL